MITREKRPSVSWNAAPPGVSYASVMLHDQEPTTTRSTSPSPATQYARCTSPFFAYFTRGAMVGSCQQHERGETVGMTDWVDITRRNSRSVQTTIGWIFWDPGAVARYEQLGLPGPLGYIASRAAPLGPAGADAT